MVIDELKLQIQRLIYGIEKKKKKCYTYSATVIKHAEMNKPLSQCLSGLNLITIMSEKRIN